MSSKSDSDFDPTHEQFVESGETKFDVHLRQGCPTFAEVVHYYSGVDVPHECSQWIPVGPRPDPVSVESGHGTIVAGVAAGYARRATDNVQVSGTAPGARLAGLSVSAGAPYNIVSAFNWILENHASADARVAALRQDQARVRRSMDRYFAAFEQGTMRPATCQERLDNLQGRLDALIAEKQALLTQGEADSPPPPELVAEWAQTLDVALHSGTTQQRKALIRKLVKELRVIGRDEIIPTYRIPALVRAPGKQVDPIGIEPTTFAMPWRRSTN